MCGICGYVSRKFVSKGEFEKMNDAMIHRGPDDGEVCQIELDEVQIGFGHRRLSILDLSKLGHQPMRSRSDLSLITYNGEIYNFKDIRKELESKGHVFRSNCDTEVILEAYEEYGEACVSKFNGMFAFAILDSREKKIFLARDRFGVKPLYYYLDKESKCFVFASTLRPIMFFPYFIKKLDKKALYRFFYYGYIAEPRSIFEDVFKLEPGGTLSFEIESFKIEKSRYWNIFEVYSKAIQNPIYDYTEASEKLRELLLRSVERRLIADVPTGTFLSGGIDSTLITALAQQVSDRPVNTYSIGFYDKKFDESVYAEEISRYLGTNHHNYMLSEEEIYTLLDDLPFFYDEPFSDSSQLPTMMVSKMARQDITVALTGDGGDELFCGYSGYDNLLKMEKYKKMIRGLGPLINNKLAYRFASPRVRTVMNEAGNNSCQWVSTALKELLDRLLLCKEDDIIYSEGEFQGKDNIQVRRMLLDISTYLPGDILHKVDRASMKYSLESRCPFLDYEVAELSLRIPHEYKYRDGIKKYILKKLTYEYVPENLLNRPKKGFSIPLKEILQTSSIKREMDDYLEQGFIEKQGLFHYGSLKEIRDIVYGMDNRNGQAYIGNAVNIMWNYLVFQKWFNVYMGD